MTQKIRPDEQILNFPVNKSMSPAHGEVLTYSTGTSQWTNEVSSGLPVPFALPNTLFYELDGTPIRHNLDPGNADTIYVYPSVGDATITGFDGGTHGRLLFVYNIFGEYILTLAVQDTGSDAENRIQANSPVLLGAYSGVLLQYDGTISNWRVVGNDNHNLLSERDNTDSHPSSAISIPTGSFNGNLDDTITSVSALAGAVDDLLMANNGWTRDSDTWTRTGNHTFTKSGDATATYQKGTKVRYKDGGAFEYGVVASSSHAAGTTTITLLTNTDYTMAAATITDTYYSYIENPQGWPDYFNFAIGYTGFSANPTTTKAVWRATGKFVRIYYIQNALGNSNLNTFTLTGLPVAIAAATVLHPTMCWGANNSANVTTPLRVDISGTVITLHTTVNGGTTWSATGTKGVYALDLTYEF